MAKAAKTAGASAVAEVDLSVLKALLDAWGISWDEVKGRLAKQQELHPDLALTIAEIVSVLDGYVNRVHMANMLQAAATLVYEALQSGVSGNELDPSSLS